jgi:rhodanese-related sulfurtransferase
VSVPEIPAADLAAKQAEGAAILDVRQPDEFEAGHVAGAQLIPMAELPEQIDDVPAADTLYVICRTGSRSERASEWLRRQGIDAVNVAGGMVAWVAAGHPVETGPQA